MRGGIDPGDNHVRPQYVGVVDVWRDLPSEDCTLSSPGVDGPTNWGFHTVRDDIDSGDQCFRPRLVEFCRYPEGFMIRGWDLILTGWRWLHEPQVRVSTPWRGRYRPGGSPFLSPVCWSCRCMEGFLIRGWGVILTRWCWLYERQVEVSTSLGAVSTRGTAVFVPGLLNLYIYGRISEPGMGYYPPRVRRYLGLVPTGNCQRALAP